MVTKLLLQAGLEPIIIPPSWVGGGGGGGGMSLINQTPHLLPGGDSRDFD